MKCVIETIQKSEEYQIVHGMLREAYDYNIPDVLGMDYFRLFNNSPKIIQKHSFEIGLTKEHEIPWKYLFNMYAFAQFPVYELEDVLRSDQCIFYKKAMADYEDGIIDLEEFLVALENYLDLLDSMLVDYYGSHRHGNQFFKIFSLFPINNVEIPVIKCQLQVIMRHKPFKKHKNWK